MTSCYYVSRDHWLALASHQFDLLSAKHLMLSTVLIVLDISTDELPI